MRTLDQVAAKVQALKDAARERDQRQRDVRDVRSGDIDTVVPGSMPDPWPHPIVANMIEVDGRDIREYSLRDYRRTLALVLPESTIFDGTIRENLCYGNPDASEESMIKISEAVGLHDFVMSLSNGYDARLGTGGLKLSAGNQQRIGIARALISEPFILILDEATASLDPESAQAVSDAIRSVMEGRTSIVILSRVLMAKEADRIIVMDQGEVVETGTYDKLIFQADSLYREIYGKQYGEDRLPPVEEE